MKIIVYSFSVSCTTDGSDIVLCLTLSAAYDTIVAIFICCSRHTRPVCANGISKNDLDNVFSISIFHNYYLSSSVVTTWCVHALAAYRLCVNVTCVRMDNVSILDEREYLTIVCHLYIGHNRPNGWIYLVGETPNSTADCCCWMITMCTQQTNYFSL